MKTLADVLVNARKTDGEYARFVGHLLRKPEKNHSQYHLPMIERFVFSESDRLEVYENTKGLSVFQRDILMSAFRLPMPMFWLEAGLFGYFVCDNNVLLFHKFKKTAEAVAASTVDQIKAPGDFLRYGEIFNRDDQNWWFQNGNAVAAAFACFAALCNVINSPRACTRERIVPGRDLSLTRRLMERRKAQRAPLYSFNKMTLIRPDTSVQSSGSVLCGAQTSKRGHWVIGHWRLIEGNAEPYWTWIESHKRGDDDLGFVAHERHVRLAPGSFGTRRGFVIPVDPGQRGEKRPAEVAG